MADMTAAPEEWRDAWHIFRNVLTNKPEEAPKLTGLVDRVYNRLKLKKECGSVRELVDFYFQHGHKALKEAFPGETMLFYFKEELLWLERVAYYKRYLEVRPQGDPDSNKIVFHRK